MPERLFQKPRITQANYGRQRFHIESPAELQIQMHDRVKSKLRQLHRRHIDKFTTAFELPRELHFVPLFERVLFDHLVVYHNSTATTQRFVHPSAFIVLSPDTKDCVPVTAGARLPMELASEHEAKHWFEVESDKQKGDEPNYVFYDLYWEKDPQGKFETLKLGCSTSSFAYEDSPVINWSMSPSYPSHTDFDAMKKILPLMNKPQQLVHRVKMFISLRKKAVDQGLLFFRSPINLDVALSAVYQEWQDKNKNKIKMSVYPLFRYYG